MRLDSSRPKVLEWLPFYCQLMETVEIEKASHRLEPIAMSTTARYSVEEFEEYIESARHDHEFGERPRL